MAIVIPDEYKAFTNQFYERWIEATVNTIDDAFVWIDHSPREAEPNKMWLYHLEVSSDDVKIMALTKVDKFTPIPFKHCPPFKSQFHSLARHSQQCVEDFYYRNSVIARIRYTVIDGSKYYVHCAPYSYKEAPGIRKGFLQLYEKVIGL